MYMYRVSWVRVPPEAAHFFLGKVTALGVLCCFALFVCLFVCLPLLASFFLPSHLSFKNMYMYESDCLGCAVLLFVCLTLFSFFLLISH